MAEADFQDPFADYAAPTDEAPAKPFKLEDQSGELQSGDTWKAVKSGVQSGVAGPLLAGGRYLSERAGAGNLNTIFKNLGISSDEFASENIEEMSPAARRALQSTLTSGEFWEAPGRATYLKAMNMTPTMAAMLVPAALVSGPIGATAMAAVANGTLNAGAAAQEIYSKIDAMPDEELRKEVPFYATLREMGLDEKAAREKYNQKTQGEVPLLNFIIGAATGAAGPGGAAARALKGGSAALSGAGKGVLARTAAGVGEGAASEALEEGSQDVTVQNALINNKLQKEFKFRQTVDKVAEGALLGGVMSAAPSALSGGHGAKAKVAAPEVEIVETGNLAPDEKAALSASVTPPKPEIVAPDVTPEEIAPVVPEAAPTPALVEAAPEAPPALAPGPAPVPENVVAASERVSQAELQPAATVEDTKLVTQEVTAPPVEGAAPVPDTVPENVAAASGRILRSQAPESLEAERLTKEAQAVAKPQLGQDLAGEKISKGKNRTKAEIAKRDTDAVMAKKIFETATELPATFPKTPEERAQLHERVNLIVDAATKNGIDLSKIKSYEGTADHMVYLREAYDLKKTLDKKSTPPKRRDEHILDFVGREAAAKGGDFTVMRAERKAAGEMAKRVNAGDVDTKAAGAPVLGVEAPTETAQVVSAQGEKVTIERAVAASPVRKIEITPEMRAKYETKPVSQPVTKRIALAAKETNTAPTEAQKVAGNYAKGHVSVQGLDITIENPRGSERSGKDANGKPWKVTLPDHYGYIKRTEGADGDHVDVYVGPKPESDHVFVIDQNDLTTGKFDEHKVMLGYDDATRAMEAYEKAFSDGKGFDRIGKIKPMTMEQFKDWLKNGDTKIEAAAHQSKITSGVTNKKGEHVEPLYTTTVAEVMNTIKTEHLKGPAARLVPFIMKRMKALVGDTQVHVFTNEDLGKFSNYRFQDGDLAPFGYTIAYVNKGPVIALNIDRLTSANQTTHTVVHEAIHAASLRAIENNPEFKDAIRSLMSDAEYAIIKRFDGDMPGEFGYAFTNEHEFLAEAFSNQRFQQFLADTPLAEYNAGLVGLGQRRVATLWDFFVASVRRMLRGLGVQPHEFSMLEGAMRLGETIMEAPQKNVGGAKALALGRADAQERVADVRTNAGGKLRRVADYLSSTIMLGDRAEPILPGSRNVVDLLSQRESEKAKILAREGGQQLVTDLAAYERKHGADGMAKLADVGFDASMLNIDPSPGAKNEHLGKDKTVGWQAKAALPKVQAAYNALPADGKALLKRTAEFFKKIQNDIGLQGIKNVLALAGVNDPALAQRIFTDGVTDADKALFKTNTALNVLNDWYGLKQLQGWYVPFRRYGDWVVNAYSEVKAPPGATKIGDDTVQFHVGGETAARRAAKNYVVSHDLRHVGTKHLWVDKNDPTKELDADHQDAVPAYRVTLQNQATEFFESEAAAVRAQDEAAKSGRFTRVDGVRKKEDFGGGGDKLSGHMHTLEQALEKQQRFKDMSAAERASVRQTLNEMASRVLGSTRLQSTFQQRRNVAGFSENIGRVTADYAGMASGYLAKLRLQPRIDEAFTKLQKYVTDHKDWEAGDNTARRRDELLSELRNRVYNSAPVGDPSSFAGKASRRLLQISRLDKLAGVSFHVINAQEPWTTSLPVIGGRHGFGAAAKGLASAYNLIGGRGAVLAGLKDTVGAFRKDNGFTDYLTMFKANLLNSNMAGGEKVRRLNEVIDYLNDRGMYNQEAIFEVRSYADPTQNALLRGLDRADLMANQVGDAIEKINRTVTAITAYELEFKKNGGNHEAALNYAYKTTHDTMGDYSSWNSAAPFKSNAGMLALQFKKFAHKTYYLLGNTLKGTLRRDPEAAKQFAGLMVTHAVVAGALGLPIEPFKVALMAANLFGVTGFTPQDFDTLVREKAAAVLGAKGGEAFSHGLTRLIGVDTSTRQGWDSLLTFGAPKDATKANDLKAWLFDTAAGAPAGMVLDWAKSAQALSKGDFAKAFELAVPIKAVTDVTRAVTGLSPKLDERGRQTRPGYTIPEAIARGIGFAPASEAENYAKRAAIGAANKKFADQRQVLIDAWVNAKGPVEKTKAQRAAMEWNKSQPKDARIMPKDLLSAGRKRANEIPGEIKTSKRNQHIFDKLAPAYVTP